MRAAISVQGEDGQFLAGFEQVDKDDLSSTTSLEVKQPAAEEPEASKVSTPTSSAIAGDVSVWNTVNGNSYHPESAPEPESDVQTKVSAAAEVTSKPVFAPAAGDGSTDAIVSEPFPQ
ncbi:hypothetical protein D915_002588 [Fasciola hepatica]|uniref:Uncharacterized protein n=1 Tax=Fasciola hepatica TaxID=6192 RepID=A0A2H1CMF1_FASHE|nr:hypothetical protein D915_002588 [Fasciola hepatica]